MGAVTDMTPACTGVKDIKRHPHIRTHMPTMNRRDDLPERDLPAVGKSRPRAFEPPLIDPREGAMDGASFRSRRAEGAFAFFVQACPIITRILLGHGDAPAASGVIIQIDDPWNILDRSDDQGIR